VRRTSTLEVSVLQKIQVEVIAPLPEGWGICLSCEMLMARANLDKAPYERGMDEFPPDWQENFHRLSDIILNLSARYADSLMIRIYDPRSLQGLAKSLRHSVHRYPTFIVDGKQKVSGWDIAHLEEILLSKGALTNNTSQGPSCDRTRLS
jgi:hypothetical protein